MAILLAVDVTFVVHCFGLTFRMVRLPGPLEMAGIRERPGSETMGGQNAVCHVIKKVNVH